MWPLKKPGGCSTSDESCRNERRIVSFILVVDADPAAAKEIAELLGAVGLETRTATSGEDALAVAGGRRPQAVLLEVRLPGVCGYEVLQELRHRYGEMLPIMFVSGERVEPFDRVAGLLLGADDYVVKPFARDELIARVRRLVVRSASNEPGALRSKLTRREQEVLQLLASGLTQREIERELVISSSTVASHIEHILDKLGVHSRAQAVALALRGGFFGVLSD
jgi:DNA-binding NarL/FixJ family response regulator